MAKITLTFDSYEDKEELEDALNGSKNAAIIEDIWNRCLRPAFKHGYAKHIQDIIEDPKMDYILNDGSIGNHALDLIEKLADIYHEVVND